MCVASLASSSSGTCQAYYSIAGGQTAYTMSSSGSYQGGFDYYCRSGAWDVVGKVCFTTPNKLATFPKACTKTEDCPSANYKDGSGNYAPCQCFPNTKGNQYCSVFPANIDNDYFTWLTNYYARDLSQCFSYELGSNYGTGCSLGHRYLDLWYRSIPSEYFPSCGRDILYSEFRYSDWH